MRRLTGLSFSPWSEKARWALDHHRISYDYEDYPPLIGELKLRLRMRKPTGRLTVPVLYDSGEWLTDSFDIARAADRIGSASRLFPEGKAAEIERWNRRSEAALDAGRAIAVLEAAKDPERVLGLVPPAVRPVLRPIAPKVLETFLSKYRMRERAGEHERVLEEVLKELEAALGEGKHLLGNELTYADIVMAVVLQFVKPVDTRFMASAPPALNTFDNSALAARYPRLLAWRDELYNKYRPVVKRPS